MADTQLMYTIAQVSAAFVAIIVGFYTSRILSLSSERQRIQNKISEIDAEIEQRNKIAQIYQGHLDEIFTEQARDSVRHFRIRLLREQVLKEFTVDELIANFKKI